MGVVGGSFVCHSLYCTSVYRHPKEKQSCYICFTVHSGNASDTKDNWKDESWKEIKEENELSRTLSCKEVNIGQICGLSFGWRPHNRIHKQL